MLRVLTVDDNRNFKKMLAEFLRSRFSATVEDAAPAHDEVIRKVETFSPLMIFADMQTLGAAYFDLTVEIKRLHPGIRIVLLSSFDIKEYMDAAHACGADRCLLKNCSTPDDIIELVESMMSHPREGG